MGERPDDTTVHVGLDARTWRAHAGRWIAVAKGEIVASGERYYQTLAALRRAGVPDPEDCDFVAWVPDDENVKFDRWHERAVVAGREFRRRLRG